MDAGAPLALSPFSFYFTRKHHHEHPQRCFSKVILDVVKLTLMMNHCTCNFQATLVKQNSMLLTYIIFQTFFSPQLCYFKLFRMYWRDRSVVMISCCSCRGFLFYSPYSHGLLQQSITSDPGDLMDSPFWSLKAPDIHAIHVHTRKQITTCNQAMFTHTCSRINILSSAFW